MNCDRHRPSLSNSRHSSQNVRRPIATAWTREFLPLNKSLAVMDDRTNTAISFILPVNGGESMTIRCGNCLGGNLQIIFANSPFIFLCVLCVLCG
ncbi:hypothetical protein [Microcoleus sp. B4-D4]|uniref:hypothetical protein n=1 Tax=Microcoleus sp. B4-D4 TaxID=2818667 RepID=UPI002FD46CC7